MTNVKFPFSLSWPRWIPVVLFCFLAAHGVGRYDARDDAIYLNCVSNFVRQVPLAERTPRIFLMGGGDMASIRMTVWLPTLAVSSLGPSIYWSSVIATFLCAFALVVIVAFLWRRDYEPKIPIIAAAILATNPLFLTFSTCIYPGAYQTAFMVLAVVQYQRCSARNRNDFHWVFVGMWIGFATLARQSALLLFPILVIHRLWVVSRKAPPKAYVWSVVEMGLGGLIVFLLSMAFMAWWFHRPWYLFECQAITKEASRLLPWYESNTADPLAYYYILVSRHFAHLGLILVAAAIVSCFGRGGPKLEAIIGLVYLGYLMFGSVNLTEYVRVIQTPRYLIPCIPFFAMCSAYQASRILDAWKRYWTKRRPPFAWMLRLGWVTLCLILTFSAMVAIDEVTPHYPVQVRLSLIRGAIRDVGSPTFVTAGFKRCYVPLLTDKELNALHIFSHDKSLPERYTVLVGEVDWFLRHLLGSSPVLEETSWPWEYSTASRPHLVISWPRRLLDRLRERDLAWYRRKENIWFRYYTPLYRIDFDINGPKRTESSLPPWKRGYR